MAKLITRTIPVNIYTFGVVDVQTTAITNVHTIETSETMGQRKQIAYSKSHGGAVLLKHEVQERKYGMPVDLFMATAAKWAQESAANQLAIDEAKAEDEQ